MIDKGVLREILIDNRKMVANMKVIRRDVALRDELRYVFVGVRRAGKSFLMFQRMQDLLAKGKSWNDMLYINFEDDRLYGFDVHDFDTILTVHKEMGGQDPILFLDEVQNIEGWEKFARRLADHKYMVYITGSNAKMLSSDVATTLGGRYVVKNVFPYGWDEYLNANGIDKDDLFFEEDTRERLLDEYVRQGGFPECAAYQEKKDYLFSLYQKIFLGDIAMRNKVENPNALRLMFIKMAESVKQPIALTRLANIINSVGTKVSKNTVINYAGYAKDSFLILPIKNFADNFTERETNQKYYFIDNGIIDLLTFDCLTSQLENVVALTLMRRYGIDDRVYFYNYNVEVDFVIPEKEMAIQVCYTLGDEGSDTFNRETKSLVTLAKRFPYKKLLIVTYNEENTIYVNDTEIEVVPLWKWMLEE
ncbi:MAG: ATP-binding protein [Paludibacteraceae bacterium]|nr:ATP-binding protein [Paludibacteraceae bacterium]